MGGLSAGLAVFVGGGLGALARWGITLAARRGLPGPFPWGTLAANLLGCFAVGVVAEFFLRRAMLPPSIKLGVVTGFLGGLTTFSSFTNETARLLALPGAGLAVVNVVANVGLGLAATLAGMWLAIHLFGAHGGAS